MRRNKYFENIFFYLLGFILFLLAAFRPIGFDNDSLQYERAILSFIEEGKTYLKFEPTFYLIIKISSLIFSFDIVRGVFIIYAFLGIFITFFGIKRHSNLPLFSLIFYIFSYFILLALNQIRGGVAIGIFLLSLNDLYSGNLYRYLFKNLIAFLFHYLAVIFLFLYPIRKIDNRFFWIFLPIIGILIYFSINNVAPSWINSFLQKFPSNYRIIYGIIMNKIGPQENFNVFNFWYAFLTLVFFFFSYIILISKKDFNFLLFKIFSFSMFIYYLLSAFHLSVVTFRVTESLNTILLILIPNIIVLKVKQKKILLIFFLLLYFYYMMHLLINTKAIHI